MNGQHCVYLLYKSKCEVKYDNIEDIDVKGGGWETYFFRYQTIVNKREER